jgi:hypothetical protein
VRKADNLPPACADVKNSGGLNLLEPCWPVQACDGTALSSVSSIFQSVQIIIMNMFYELTSGIAKVYVTLYITIKRENMENILHM